VREGEGHIGGAAAAEGGGLGLGLGGGSFWNFQFMRG
jgi:hypothetical protein